MLWIAELSQALCKNRELSDARTAKALARLTFAFESEQN